jgi:hypothetical protein
MTTSATQFSSGYPVDPDAPADLVGWRSAAVARGYSYTGEWVHPELTGLLFSEGENVVATDIADALNSNAPFLAGSLTANYAAAGGTLETSFIAFPLSRSMPSVVLVNARRGALRQANIGMGSRQMLSLRGNFDRAFTLYCPIGHEDVALDVFTPELMQMFLEAIPGSDAELVDDWLFVYGGAGRCTSPDSLDRIERLSERVHDEIVRRSFDTLHDEPRPPVRPVADVPRVLRFAAILTVTTLAAAGLAWLTMWGQSGR